MSSEMLSMRRAFISKGAARVQPALQSPNNAGLKAGLENISSIE
jgi:hypothetical protein